MSDGQDRLTLTHTNSSARCTMKFHHSEDRDRPNKMTIEFVEPTFVVNSSEEKTADETAAELVGTFVENAS